MNDDAIKKKYGQRKKGLFIVCEGLDGAGKTTSIKEYLKLHSNENYVYSKGLKSETFLGKWAAKNPSTLLFLLELVYVTHKIIKPALRKDKVILQDRYDLSVSSFAPFSEKWYNRAIVFILKPYLKQPDLLVYFNVSLEEGLRRLQATKENRYHSALIKNPSLIDFRGNKYLQLFNNQLCKKAVLDTTNKSIADVVNEFECLIDKYTN